ncbi:HPP family-domain-containing protein, partial [Phakopsora pachyrhizi]
MEADMCDKTNKVEFSTRVEKKREKVSKEKILNSLRSFKRRASNFDLRPDLPFWISRFLGYQSGSEYRPVWMLRWLDKCKIPRIVKICFGALLSSFAVISMICAVFSTSSLANLPIPIVLAPAGAIVISLYGSPLAPSSSPRSLLLGQFWASLVSSIVTKILLDHNTMTVTVERGEMGRNLVWLAASLSLAITIVLQKLTRSLHPPGGATTVLGSINPGLVAIGFKYVGVVMAIACMVLGLAMIYENLVRRYPLYWFTPSKPLSSSEKEIKMLREMALKLLEVLEESSENTEIRLILVKLTQNI